MEKVFLLNRFIMSNEWGGCWQTHTTNTHPLSFTGNWEDYKYFFEGTRHRRELKYREIEKQESKSKIREVFAYSFHAQGLKNIMHGLLVVLPEDDTCTIYVSLSLSLSLNGINCYLFYKNLKQIKWKIGLIYGLRMASKFYYKHGDYVLILKLTIIHVVFVLYNSCSYIEVDYVVFFFFFLVKRLWIVRYYFCLVSCF